MQREQDLKAAIVKASQLSKDLQSVEIHPCEACSLKIVSKEKQKIVNRNQNWSVNANEAYQEEGECNAGVSHVQKDVLGPRLSDNFYRASI